MVVRVTKVSHEDKLTLVEHLDELRTRILICITALLIVGGVCIWQDDRILSFVNAPLEGAQRGKPCGQTRDPLEQSACWQQSQSKLNAEIAKTARALGQQAGETPALAARAAALAKAADAAVAATPKASGSRPVTLGVGEPLTVTLAAAGYAALLITLPLLLYQLYAFVLPAFSPREREVALPLMLMVPILFYSGVAFSYLFVLPAAVDFLQNFNDDSFDVLIGARDYYRFSILVLGMMGIMFQLPILILAITRMGILTTAQLRQNRRYAIFVIAIISALLPGGDPVTMLLMMLPQLILYEGSILLAAMVDRRETRARDRALADLSEKD